MCVKLGVTAEASAVTWEVLFSRVAIKQFEIRVLRLTEY